MKSFEKMIADIPRRFERMYIPEPNSGCWIWMGQLDRGGYGYFCVGRSNKHNTVSAHILSYVLKHGKKPDLPLDHLCRMRCCVNPDHLEPVTTKINNLRGESPAAKNARKTHCKNGHTLVPPNIKPDSKRRACLVCRQEYNAATRWKYK